MTPEEVRNVLLRKPTLDALDALVARVKEAEAARDELAARLAEAERLAATREQQIAMVKRHMGERCEHLTGRAVAAEARVAALQETLRKIEQTAQWYADNDSRLDHEVDHCLCVEIPALARDALAAADRPEGTTPLDEARAVYEAMARLLTSEGCRRQERGSGWWWAAGLDEEATVGGAVEQVLANYGIDTREPFPWETEFGWDATGQEGSA